MINKKSRIFGFTAALLQSLVVCAIFYLIHSATRSLSVSVAEFAQGTANSVETFREWYNILKYPFSVLGSAIALLVFFAVYSFRGRSLLREMEIKPIGLPDAGAVITLGVCVQIVVSLILPVLFVIFPAFNTMPEQSIVTSASVDWLFAVEFIYYTVITGIVEEIIFRAVIYKQFRRVLSPFYSILIASLIFGAAHMNMAQFVYTSILGVVLCAVYERYSSIIAPILVHVAFNGTTFAVVALRIRSFSLMIILIFCSIGIFVLSAVFIFSKKRRQKTGSAGERTPK